MTIQVKDKSEVSNEVSVVIEGECNHKGFDYEVEEFTLSTSPGEYDSYCEQVMVCRTCQAWSRIDDWDWNEQ